MKTIKTKIAALLLVVLFISCTVNEATEGNCFNSKPIEELNWLKKMKDVFATTKENAKKRIVQYTYNGEDVFAINTCVGCPNSLEQIYNCEGDTICKLGGVTNLNTCPNFYKNASNKKVLWRNYNEVIIDEKLYNNVKTNNYTIKNVKLENNSFKVTISASGCSGDSWIVNLVDSSEILESNPIQRKVKIDLQNNEACEALITKEFIFDITKLKDGGKHVILNLVGLEKTSLIGYWSNATYDEKTKETTYQRVDSLPKEKNGISFKEKDEYIERTSGWCGTPPLTFSDEKGKWELKKDTLVIKRTQGHYMGNTTLLVTKLTKNELVLKRIQTTQQKEHAEIGKLYDEIYTKFIRKISCSGSEELKAIPYGSKACGGPKGYLPFSTKMKDSAVYLSLVKEFTKKEAAFNKKWGVFSDCAIVNPPTKVICKNGKPLLKYN